MSSQSLSSLTDLLSAQTLFRMPVYQRQFSWESHQLEDLWNDLYYLEAGKRYYFGTILLKRTGEEEEEEDRAGLRNLEIFEIIDGQQRIASVLILARSILEQLHAETLTEDERRELDAIGAASIGCDDLPKLRLLGKDDCVFRALMEGKKIESAATGSQRRLLGAKALFEEKLAEQRKLHESDYKQFLLDLLKKTLHLEVMKHIVETNEEAVLIFETVNDRGIDLGSLDKTKSFLMHFLYLTGGAYEEIGANQDQNGNNGKDDNNNLSRMNDVFASIFSDMECMEHRRRALARSVRDLEKDVQRMHYIIFKSGSTYFYDAFASLKQDLVSKYRDAKRDKSMCTSEAMDYALSLASAYSAVRDILTYDKQDDLDSSLNRVFSLSYGTAFPLIISTWMKFGPDSSEIRRLMRAIESFLFRYSSFRSRRSYTTVDRINTRAFDLFHGRTTFDSVLSSLQYLTKHYAPDGAFRADLESENFYFGTKSTIKLLFYEYELFLRRSDGGGQDGVPPLSEWMSDTFQVDHVWAQAALASGKDYEEYGHCGNKLGNLSVLPSVSNAGLLNANFSLKRVAYKKIEMRVLREIAEHEQWREREINQRTVKITEFAMKRWAIPPLSG